jgi:hypothetical protein
MHYVTHSSHQMRKHKFGITSPEVLFIKSVPAQLTLKNIVSMIRSPDAPKCTT